MADYLPGGAMAMTISPAVTAVQLVPTERLRANDYNPNRVASVDESRRWLSARGVPVT